MNFEGEFLDSLLGVLTRNPLPVLSFSPLPKYPEEPTDHRPGLRRLPGSTSLGRCCSSVMYSP